MKKPSNFNINFQNSDEIYYLVEIQGLNYSANKMAALAKQCKISSKSIFIIILMKTFTKILSKSCQFLNQISKIHEKSIVLLKINM